MATSKQITEFLDQISGYNCMFTIGHRTDPLYVSFCGRLSSVNYEFDTDLMQIHVKQIYKTNSTYPECLSYFLLRYSMCRLEESSDGYKLCVVDDTKQTTITITPIANSDREVFKNNLYEQKRSEKAETPAERRESSGLACPHCGKTCSSTSGLTLHVKTCKNKPS